VTRDPAQGIPNKVCLSSRW